jgi:hypothetical protein
MLFENSFDIKTTHREYDSKCTDKHVKRVKTCWFCESVCKSYIAICENCESEKIKKRKNKDK